MSKKEDVYRGEMLVTTVTKESGFEKHVYIKETFFKDGVVHVETEGAQLAVRYDLEKIEQFVKLGIVSIQDGEKLKEDIISLENQMKDWKQWKEQHPNTTKEEKSKAFLEITGSATMNQQFPLKSEESRIYSK